MNIKTGLALLATATIMLCSSLPALAAGELLVLPTSTRVLHAQEQTIKVRNDGDAPLYLAINLAQVSNPGLVPEHKLMLRDLPHPGMLATPEKLVLGPNQSREIHLKSLEEPEQESLYRLYITPVNAFSVTDAPQERIAAPMSFAVGYGVLVRHLPAPERQKNSWTYHCENNQIALSNTGNVRLRLSEMQLLPGGHSPQSAIGLFPGMPQRFNASKITMNVDDQPVTVSCS